VITLVFRPEFQRGGEKGGGRGRGLDFSSKLDEEKTDPLSSSIPRPSRGVEEKLSSQFLLQTDGAEAEEKGVCVHLPALGKGREGEQVLLRSLTSRSTIAIKWEANGIAAVMFVVDLREGGSFTKV